MGVLGLIIFAIFGLFGVPVILGFFQKSAPLTEEEQKKKDTRDRVISWDEIDPDMTWKPPGYLSQAMISADTKLETDEYGNSWLGDELVMGRYTPFVEELKLINHNIYARVLQEHPLYKHHFPKLPDEVVYSSGWRCSYAEFVAEVYPIPDNTYFRPIYDRSTPRFYTEESEAPTYHSFTNLRVGWITRDNLIVTNRQAELIKRRLMNAHISFPHPFRPAIISA